MDNDQLKKRKTRNDFIFIGAVAFFCVFVGIAFYFFRADGNSVSVSVNGEHYGDFSLDDSRTVEIISDGGYNTLVIENGQAYVKEASCPDGICSSHKPISRSGESIVCLPNKVVITVNTDASEDAPDIVA